MSAKLHRIWVTRPRRYGLATARRLRRLGYSCRVYPLLRYRLCAPPRPSARHVSDTDVLVFTSAFAVEAFSEVFSGKPRRARIFCVGDSTAQAALKFFGSSANIISAGGDVETLQKLITDNVDRDCRITHYAASETAGDLCGALGARGFSHVEKIALYETTATDSLSAAVLRDLRAGQCGGVLLYSPKTGRVFSGLVRHYGLLAEMARIPLYCLSGNVAESLDFQAHVRIAEEPTESSLIETIRLPNPITPNPIT